MDLLTTVVQVLQEMGGEVRLFAEADNCVRRRESVEPIEGSFVPAALPFVIEVQGVPNLLHELAHVLLLGRVEKDHGTPYAKIPFDMTTDEGRRLLFEEFACCVASCAWHPGDDAAADAWFAEQVGIQGCFFGMEAEGPRFLAAVDAVVTCHRDELDRVIERARAAVEEGLRRSGAPESVARPRRLFPFDAAWRSLRNLRRS